MARARRAAAAAEGVAATGSVRWVRPDAFHLTLRFLGATPPERVGEAVDAIDDATAGCPPFRVALGRLTVIGGRSSRILVCELADGIDEMARLEALLTAALGRRGWPPETRPFRPHVTLARSRGPVAQLLTVARTARGEGIGWTAGDVVLFESRLGSGPPTYVRNAVAALSG